MATYPIALQIEIFVTNDNNVSDCHGSRRTSIIYEARDIFYLNASLAAPWMQECPPGLRGGRVPGAGGGSRKEWIQILFGRGACLRRQISPRVW